VQPEAISASIVLLEQSLLFDDDVVAKVVVEKIVDEGLEVIDERVVDLVVDLIVDVSVLLPTLQHVENEGN
jgi:hypothetical protein